MRRGWRLGRPEAKSVYDVNSGVKLERHADRPADALQPARVSRRRQQSGATTAHGPDQGHRRCAHDALPAPVELPCAAGETGRLCDRNAAIYDVTQRFGEDSRSTIAGLQILFDGSPLRPKSGDTQSCTRTMKQNTRIAAAAGHMHLLGKSISIDVNPGTARARTVLNIDQWDFDNQGAPQVAEGCRSEGR